MTADQAGPDDRWDYDRHPGDCHPRREDDGTWTVCCRECAGTGVFPVPWIDTPSEGRRDPDACSDTYCKGTGRQTVVLGGFSPADHAAALAERDAGERSRMEWDDAMRQQERDRHAAALAQAKAEGGQEVAARVEAVLERRGVEYETQRLADTVPSVSMWLRLVAADILAALTPDAGAHDRRVRAEVLREAADAAWTTPTFAAFLRDRADREDTTP